jgi:hypothetical protein
VDLLIRPKLTSYSRTEMDSGKIKELIDKGYQTTVQKIEESPIF